MDFKKALEVGDRIYIADRLSGDLIIKNIQAIHLSSEPAEIYDVFVLNTQDPYIYGELGSKLVLALDRPSHMNTPLVRAFAEQEDAENFLNADDYTFNIDYLDGDADVEDNTIENVFEEIDKQRVIENTLTQTIEQVKEATDELMTKAKELKIDDILNESTKVKDDLKHSLERIKNTAAEKGLLEKTATAISNGRNLLAQGLSTAANVVADETDQPKPKRPRKYGRGNG